LLVSRDVISEPVSMLSGCMQCDHSGAGLECCKANQQRDRSGIGWYGGVGPLQVAACRYYNIAA